MVSDTFKEVERTIDKAIGIPEGARLEVPSGTPDPSAPAPVLPAAASSVVEAPEATFDSLDASSAALSPPAPALRSPSPPVPSFQADSPRPTASPAPLSTPSATGGKIDLSSLLASDASSPAPTPAPTASALTPLRPAARLLTGTPGDEDNFFDDGDDDPFAAFELPSSSSSSSQTPTPSHPSAQREVTESTSAEQQNHGRVSAPQAGSPEPTGEPTRAPQPTDTSPEAVARLQDSADLVVVHFDQELSDSLRPPMTATATVEQAHLTVSAPQPHTGSEQGLSSACEQEQKQLSSVSAAQQSLPLSVAGDQQNASCSEQGGGHTPKSAPSPLAATSTTASNMPATMDDAGEAARLRSLLQRREEQLVALTGANGQLTEELSRTEAKQREAEKRAHTAEGQLAELASERDSARQMERTRLAALEHNLAAVSTERDRLRVQLTQKGGQLAGELQERTEEAEALRQEGEALSKKQLHLETILKRLRTKEKESESQLSALNARLRTVQAELAAQQQRVCELQNAAPTCTP
jgi:TATA element modulatory factor 1 DNA binding